MAPLTWEFKLAPAVGSDRLTKFTKNAADEEALSAALAIQWLHLAAKTVVKDLNFAPDVVSRVAPVTKLVKARGFLGVAAAVTTALPALGTDAGLALAAVGQGKIVAGGSAELADAIKKLEKDGLYLLYLFATNAKVYHCVAIQRKAGEKRLFDPYRGQYVAKESAEAAAECVSVNPAFDGFVVFSAAGEAVAGPKWDWDFDQGKMIDALTSGDYSATRGGKTLRQLYPDDCEGICLSMTYHWLKALMAGKKPSSGEYLEPKKFAGLAKVQNKVDDDILELMEIAKKEGYTIHDVDACPSDNKPEAKPVMGYFAGKTEELVFKIDQLKPGYYFLWLFGDGGHYVGFQKTGKETGKFFDPNFGQCTVEAGGESLGALVGAVLNDCKMYKKDFVAFDRKGKKWGNSYQFLPLTKK